MRKTEWEGEAVVLMRFCGKADMSKSKGVANSHADIKKWIGQQVKLALAC